MSSDVDGNLQEAMVLRTGVGSLLILEENRAVRATHQDRSHGLMLASGPPPGASCRVKHH
jgi:hypothetical protein